DYACARAMAEEQGDVAAQAEILLDEATALDWLTDWKGSKDRLEEARARIAERCPPLLSARILLGLGRTAHRFSANDEAVVLLERTAIDRGHRGARGARGAHREEAGGEAPPRAGPGPGLPRPECARRPARPAPPRARVAGRGSGGFSKAPDPASLLA